MDGALRAAAGRLESGLHLRESLLQVPDGLRFVTGIVIGIALEHFNDPSKVSIGMLEQSGWVRAFARSWSSPKSSVRGEARIA